MKNRPEDPVLTTSRREAILVFFIWLAACTYTVGYCITFGYHRDADSLTYVLGFPDWIFWGIIVPWTACTILCFFMANYFIADADLGEEQAETDLKPIEETLGQEGDHA